jgi:DNA helicase-4
MENLVPIRQWTGSSWEIALEQEFLSIRAKELNLDIPFDDTVALHAKWNWFRWQLVSNQGLQLKLKGASRYEARLIALSIQLSKLRIWSESLQGILKEHRKKQRWIPLETIYHLIDSRPNSSPLKKINRYKLINRLSPSEVQALKDFELDLSYFFEQTNKDILEAELISQKNFLESVESKPLTLEQSKAVLMLDNRVLLVAAAGSGKTSVMVARAAYATMKNFIAPSRILLLAFNAAAAAELQERVTNRFASAGIDPKEIKASTFHAFGLSVLGKTSQAKPKVASWVDKGMDLEEIDNIVDELKKSSEDFKYKWDLYRLIFTPETLKITGIEPDAYESQSRERGFRTFDGKLVRSHGERMIANWLYLHGVKYEYERDYKVKTANEFRRQYMPDFYYPQIDAWHEHWALDINGNPPKDFTGYAEEMEWKRNLHRINNSDLIESTFGEVVFSNGLSKIKEQLLQRGLKLNWDPDRPKAPYTNIENSELIGLIRSFMSHVKSNSLTKSDIELRLVTKWAHLKSERTNLFLELFWPIYHEWNQRLQDANAIDFEDMLVQASIEIENGKYVSPYDMILVDEFQDSSAARARLVNALVQNRGKYVLAVGDDWQSINRFAGADVSLMTRFNGIFGEGPTLLLSRTFRCSQIIADVATKFVIKNPEQIKKTVVAEVKGVGHPVTLIRSNNPQAGVLEALKQISKDVSARNRTKGSVFILGRYRFNRDWVPDEDIKNLDISFKTIHGSKGLEADYVVVVNFEAGQHGFPSEIEDDPVLNLAMTEPETFDYAEERRLLYVALTRAKEQVFLVTRQNKDSMFAVELMTDLQVDVIAIESDGPEAQEVQTCSDCKKGVMVKRSGPRGPFLGCSRFPKCVHTARLGTMRPKPKY